LPSSVVVPLSITTIRSAAFTVDKRCAIKMFGGVLEIEVERLLEISQQALDKPNTSLRGDLQLLGFLNRLLGFGVQVFKQGWNILRSTLQNDVKGISYLAACRRPGWPGGFSLTVLHEG
jgi:hypothetical protein